MNCEYSTIEICVCACSVCVGLYSHGRANVYSSSGDTSSISGSGATRRGRDRCQGSQHRGLWITDWRRNGWWRVGCRKQLANSETQLGKQRSLFQSNHIKKIWWISSLRSPFVSLWARSPISLQLYIWSSHSLFPLYISLTAAEKQSAHLPSLCTVNHSLLCSLSLSLSLCLYAQLHVGCQPFTFSTQQLTAHFHFIVGERTHIYTFLSHI